MSSNTQKAKVRTSESVLQIGCLGIERTAIQRKKGDEDCCNDASEDRNTCCSGELVGISDKFGIWLERVKESAMMSVRLSYIEIGHLASRTPHTAKVRVPCLLSSNSKSLLSDIWAIRAAVCSRNVACTRM